MCAATDLDEQRRLWNAKIRPVLLSSTLTKLFFSNPVFLWNALGPSTSLFLVTSSVAESCPSCRRAHEPGADLPRRDDRRSVRRRHVRPRRAQHVGRDRQLLLPAVPAGKVHQELLVRPALPFSLSSSDRPLTPLRSPAFLTRSGFDKLKKDNAAALDCMRIHTDSIAKVRASPPSARARAALTLFLPLARRSCGVSAAARSPSPSSWTCRTVRASSASSSPSC